MTAPIPLRVVVDRLSAEGLLSGDAPDQAQGEVRAVRTDSRRLAPGDLFCAVRGSAADGHLHLADAAARGAAAALVERVDPSVVLPQYVVRNGRLAAAHAAAAAWQDPWDDITLIGVTGTNGKTTTTAILRHLLGRRAPAGSIGTLGVIGADGTVLPGSEGLTTPGPAEAAEWLHDLRAAGVRSVAMEVSSHALEQHRLAAARFDAAVFTNLSRDHLDYHGTMEAYREAKLAFLDLTKADGAAVVNADDPAWRDVVARRGRTVRFGTGASADIRVEDVVPGPAGVDMMLRTPDGVARTRIPLLGLFNVANAVAAAAALWSIGWSAAEIADGFPSIPQVPGRLERAQTPAEKATVVIDYAHTPDALARALDAVRPFTSNRLVAVFGAGGDRDPGKRADMGRVAAEAADLVIVTSDNPRNEDPARIADAIESGMGSAPRLRVLDRREAIRRALQETGPGDVVLLAGKGHERYQIWGDEQLPFDEREVLREILAEGGAGL